MDARTKYTQAALAAGGIWSWSAAQTAWGRDSEMWPGLLDLIPDTGAVWCAGVATGEEALTLAARTPDTVSIVASDLALPALKTAWEGAYPRGMVDAAVDAGDITSVEAARIFADYDDCGEWLHVGEAISARIRWWPHDLVDHAPLTSVDVVLCRNVLPPLPRQDRAGVVDRLARMGAPVVVGTTDLLHTGRDWLAGFTPADSPFVLRPSTVRRASTSQHVKRPSR